MVDNGSIVFDTIPSGARVSIDEEFFDEITPLHITDVFPGTYIIRVVHDEYTDFTSSLTVESNKTTNIKVDLDKGTKIEEHTDIKSDEIQKIGIPDEEPVPTLQEKENEKDILSEHLKEMNNILSSVNENTRLIKEFLSEEYSFNREQSYFTTGLTAVSVSTPTKPGDFNIIANPNTTPATPGYDKVEVNVSQGRNARHLSFLNNGSTTIFVLVSHNGLDYSKQEVQVFQGQMMHFYNVYELRIRSPVAGNLVQDVATEPGGLYIASEYDSTFNTNNINQTAIFITTFPNLNVLGAGFVTFSITDPIFNLSSVFRASVTNTDNVYYTYLGGDISNSFQRDILGPGDVLKVNLTQGGQVFFAGASSGQTIALVSETNITY